MRELKEGEREQGDNPSSIRRRRRRKKRVKLSPLFFSLPSFCFSFAYKNNPQMGPHRLRRPAQEATGRVFVREGECFLLGD